MVDRDLDDVLGDVLSDDETWAGPSPHVRDAVLAAIAAEVSASPVVPITPEVANWASTEETDPGGADSADGKAGRAWAGRSRRALLTMAAAVVVAAGFLAAGFVAGSPARPTFDDEFVIEGVDPASNARATVGLLSEPSGWEIRLLAEELPAAEPGSYYAAWLQGSDGFVPLGSFHQRGGSEEIILWAGVNVDNYNTMLVTLQREGEPPQPSGVVVLLGTR